MKVRVLIENKETPFFISEHGLSLLIEQNNKKILFDTGSSSKFMDNAKKLRLDLSNINYLILSHAHYDHTSGTISFIKEYNYDKNIYVGKGFMNNKYSLYDSYEYKGTPFEISELKNLVYVDNELKIDEDFTLYSNFKENNSFEHIASNFFILNKNYEKDYFIDETVLTVNTDKGIVLIVGCSHVGICNIIDEVIKRSNKKIRGIIGGFHLSKCNTDYVLEIIEKLKKYDLEFICPMHCTGYENLFRKEFKEKCKILEVGDLLDLEGIKKEYKMRSNKLLDEEYGKQTDRNYKDGDRN